MKVQLKVKKKNLGWYLKNSDENSSMSQSCRDCEVQRECLKEKLYKIAE